MKRPVKLEDNLCFAFYKASRAFTHAYQPLLEPLGLTYPQYLAMLLLWEEDAVSVRDLGTRLALDSGTLTPLLKRLETNGLVLRRRDQNDERVVRVVLTAKGRALHTRAQSIPMALARCAGFTPDKAGLTQLESLRDAVNAVTQRLARTA